MYALDAHHSLNDLEKRLLSETNGHLITLRAILLQKSSANIEANFIVSGGYISTLGYNLMMDRMSRRSTSNRLPYPQGQEPSREMGLLAVNHTHANENRFIRGVAL